ncbi:unnamed protein product, partial [Nippostrongylus brasiliensis]|uniref:CCHC-type domain-containing protein n=1 Tax=Nippostrongylus brasiliensis TaxID=27835 RepID=A0A158R1S0_NIPBR
MKAALQKLQNKKAPVLDEISLEMQKAGGPLVLNLPLCSTNVGSNPMCQKIGEEFAAANVQEHRPRWYGHVVRDGKTLDFQLLIYLSVIKVKGKGVGVDQSSKDEPPHSYSIQNRRGRRDSLASFPPYPARTAEPGKLPKADSKKASTLYQNDMALNSENKMEVEDLQVSEEVRENVREERGQIMRALYAMKLKVGDILSETRIAKDKRAEVEKEITEQVQLVKAKLGVIGEGVGLPAELLKEIEDVLHQRGIETVDEWKTYVRTMERNGEVLSELCELLNTNVFQLGTSVRKLQEAARKGTTDEEGKTIRLASACIDDEEICSQEKDFSIGPMYASRSRRLSGTPVMSAPPVEEAEQSRRMIGTHYKKGSGVSWRHRAAVYQENRGGRTVGQMEVPVRPDGNNQNGGVGVANSGRREFEMAQQRERSSMGQNTAGERQRNVSANNSNRKCYNCSSYGHIGRECPRRSAKVNQIIDGSKSQPKLKETEPRSAIVDRVRSLGVRIGSDDGSSPLNDLVGEKMVATVKVLGTVEKALLDTGSMISIVPVEVLARARDRKIDIDALKFLEKSKLTSVHDASGNRMDFLGAVYLEVEVEGGSRDTVAFHVSATKDEELIIGTNALQRLGVELTVKGSRMEQATNRVVVSKRIYIPPRCMQAVQVKCEGELTEVAERVIWSEKRGVAAGVYAIKDKQTEIPMFNDSDEPVMYKEGDDVGYWSTDKWHDRWEDMNPFLVMSDEKPGEADERVAKLFELLEKDIEGGVLDKDLKSLVLRHAEAFA